MSEPDILTAWRALVPRIVSDPAQAAPLLKGAESLIAELPPESPLRLRLGQEYRALQRRIPA